MARLLVGNRRLQDAGLVLLALLGLLPVPLPARAQDAAGARIHYVRELSFKIPFNMDVRDGRISEVLLYVSDNYGGSYQRVASARPTDRDFPFDAPDDGWYWFAVQT